MNVQINLWARWVQNAHTANTRNLLQVSMNWAETWAGISGIYIYIYFVWLYQKESRNERRSSPRERVLQSAHTENRCKSHCYRISLAERLTDGQLVSVRRNRNFLSNTLWAVGWHSAFQALPETNQLSSMHRTLSAVNKLGHLGARRGRAAPLASCG